MMVKANCENDFTILLKDAKLYKELENVFGEKMLQESAPCQTDSETLVKPQTDHFLLR